MEKRVEVTRVDGRKITGIIDEGSHPPVPSLRIRLRTSKGTVWRIPRDNIDNIKVLGDA